MRNRESRKEREMKKKKYKQNNDSWLTNYILQQSTHIISHKKNKH